jgi:ubiquinone/menaquinone biosynthesis C-methylase UbiE
MDYLNIYSELFNANYNEYGGSEKSIEYSIDFIKKNNVKTLIDISTGTGTFPKFVSKEITDINITCTDLNKFNDLNHEFISVDLSKNEDLEKIKTNGYELLTCLDVLEHLDKSFIDNVLKNFARISKNVILTIANHSDIQNGIELHTIIENMDYWKPVIENYFDIVNLESYDFPQNNNCVNYLYALTLKSKN